MQSLNISYNQQERQLHVDSSETSLEAVWYTIVMFYLQFQFVMLYTLKKLWQHEIIFELYQLWWK